jgi:uncharacterized protein
VIAYFDTSAIIPLIIDEPSSDTCERVWNEADRSVSVRLLYPEARAALARARRVRRISERQLADAIDELELINTELTHVEVSAELAHAAGDLAHTYQLRGYDAVHLAAALATTQAEFVLVTGDTDLATAARSLGLPVAFTS